MWTEYTNVFQGTSTFFLFQIKFDYKLDFIGQNLSSVTSINQIPTDLNERKIISNHNTFVLYLPFVPALSIFFVSSDSALVVE